MLRGPRHPRRPPRGRGNGLSPLRGSITRNTFRAAVIDEFADSYLSGATPVPCIRCNEAREVQGPARDRARSRRRLHGHGPLHPAQDGPRQGRASLRRGMPRADQSYFLFSTTQEQLDYLRFPLGHLASKAETRALAAKYGLSVADKPDSQDICFVAERRLCRRHRKAAPGRGRSGRDRGHGRHRSGRTPGRDPLHDRPAPGPRHRRSCGAALCRSARPRRAPGRRRSEGGAVDPRRARARDQLAGRHPVAKRGGMACGGENPLHAPPARRDHPPPSRPPRRRWS